MDEAADVASSIDSLIQEICDEKKDPLDYQLLGEFEELITFGELVDRLCIVNIKLFKIKDIQANPLTSKEMLADSAKKDVALCAERNRIKNALTAKLEAVAYRGFNQQRINNLLEQKSYGSA